MYSGCERCIPWTMPVAALFPRGVRRGGALDRGCRNHPDRHCGPLDLECLNPPGPQMQTFTSIFKPLWWVWVMNLRFPHDIKSKGLCHSGHLRRNDTTRDACSVKLTSHLAGCIHVELHWSGASAFARSFAQRRRRRRAGRSALSD